MEDRTSPQVNKNRSVWGEEVEVWEGNCCTIMNVHTVPSCVYVVHIMKSSYLVGYNGDALRFPRGTNSNFKYYLD
jgi:hypothetical protein